jgi:chromosome segregation ATPase
MKAMSDDLGWRSATAELTHLRERNAELENELEVSESAHKTKTLMIVERTARIAELERERDEARSHWQAMGDEAEKHYDALCDAETRLTSLSAENERLRKALEKIDKFEISGLDSMVNQVFRLKNIARNALGRVK